MHGKLYQYFEQDHKRIENLLNRATVRKDGFDMASYGEFRRGLLRHIGLEEKILFPAAQKAKGGEPFASLPKLRLDHGALTALMVPPPTQTIVAAIRSILTAHDELEESAEGPYDVCEQLAGAEVETLLARVRSAPEVPVLPHRSEPFVLEATRRALERAGYNLDNYDEQASTG
ncbi:MAG TPA: hemerythrin domain-containing protein [Bacteroidota bacterium]